MTEANHEELNALLAKDTLDVGEIIEAKGLIEALFAHKDDYWVGRHFMDEASAKYEAFLAELNG